MVATRIHFGKYRNSTLCEIYQKDRNYLEWLNTQPWFKIRFHSLHEELVRYLQKREDEIQINTETFVIYTDGACKNNGSKMGNVSAGIGVHFSQNNCIQLKDISQKLSIENPTNNKAELLAIDKALESCLKENLQGKICIYTDSQYCIDAITKWYDQWSQSGKLQGKKNVEYISSIKGKLKNMDVSFVHVRGHTNKQDVHSLGNNRADNLATGCL